MNRSPFFIADHFYCTFSGDNLHAWQRQPSLAKRRDARRDP